MYARPGLVSDPVNSVLPSGDSTAELARPTAAPVGSCSDSATLPPESTLTTRPKGGATSSTTCCGTREAAQRRGGEEARAVAPAAVSLELIETQKWSTTTAAAAAAAIVGEEEEEEGGAGEGGTPKTPSQYPGRERANGWIRPASGPRRGARTSLAENVSHMIIASSFPVAAARESEKAIPLLNQLPVETTTVFPVLGSWRQSLPPRSPEKSEPSDVENVSKAWIPSDLAGGAGGAAIESVK